MFSLNVITWNTGYGKGLYWTSLDKIFFGGNTGHSSIELVIPRTEDNKRLIDSLNTKGKLKVTEDTVLNPKDIKHPVPCYRIYFSFWGDVRTRTTPERHRMVDATRDRLEEGDAGHITHYTPKGEALFGAGHPHLEVNKRKGQLGSRKSQRMFTQIFHEVGHDDAALEHANKLHQKLEALEADKRFVLQHVKAIHDEALSEEEKGAVFERYKVENLTELEAKLAQFSVAMTIVRDELTKLGMQFGLNPDNVVSFPVDENEAFTLNYKDMLKKMAHIANNRVPYNAVLRNCSTVIKDIILSGVDEALKTNLEGRGFSIPKVRMLFDTPQSIYVLSIKFHEMLTRAKLGEKAETILDKIQRFIQSILLYLYTDAPKPTIEPLRPVAEERVYLESDMDFLDREHAEGKISDESYREMKTNLESKQLLLDENERPDIGIAP